MPPVTLGAIEPTQQVASADEDQSSIVVRELPEIMPSHQVASDQENEPQAVHELSELVPNRIALAGIKPLINSLDTCRPRAIIANSIRQREPTNGSPRPV
ncbi:hypothetical protein ABVK25_001281 [Lepraria finkii]|uniref:Uncharacterized protein n=1 Tax=Lepraria finkii TaxID=1340010 RepID=A0ABR4BQS9_9LECA